ncbi:heme A synthase [Epibacterium sp. SM1969]|uniref:Heme A synthase n=1 Tax=Tritonibacter aquimaris TaxID=2663379 RepID=A0A844AQV6_9RHOB|nr:heme A synthase [Tritonibacter aquimaris]MQY41418.1 heme A synthase [Tritonibacter aquimaris]
MSKRSIFEEVDGSKAEKATPQSGLLERDNSGARFAIRIWLGVLFALVVAMIAVGGLTRLTDSGLSITEWRPVTGAIPPLSAEDWQSEFDKYKQIDQWAIDNQWMELADFKQIYWWEWGHRQLGRIIGLVWFVGFAGFALLRKIPTGWGMRLAIPGLLGGVQGAIGWWMVHSGVTQGEGVTTVASYRLAVHLGLAFLILGFITWAMLGLSRSERDLMQARRAKEAKQFSLATGLLHFSMLQILLGALVAGIDAGRSFTDWPLMNGQFFPPQAFDLEPLWVNFVENPGLVQFIHRMSGYLLVIFAVIVWRRGQKSAHASTRFAFNCVIAAMGLQLMLGIVTVLQAAHVHVAITHQLVAVLLWVLILRARFLSGYPKAVSIKDQ